MGDQDAYNKFQEHSQAFKNLFDSKDGFVRGRLDDGSWRTPFDPASNRMRRISVLLSCLQPPS
jgi:putative alpha-1,2-mannosidase